MFIQYNYRLNVHTPPLSAPDMRLTMRLTILGIRELFVMKVRMCRKCD